MGTFSAIRTAWATIITANYPTDKQVFGTPDQISQESNLAIGQDLFGFFQNFKILPAVNGNTDRTQDFGFYVGELDSYEAGSPETNAIVDRMEAKAKAIIDAFYDSEQANFMSISDVQMVPYYKGFNDTTSGVWVLCTLEVSQSIFC